MQKNFSLANELQDVALANYNLACWNNAFGNFLRANYFIKIAESQAIKEKMPEDHLQKIRSLKKSIKSFNRDIPDYIN